MGWVGLGRRYGYGGVAWEIDGGVVSEVGKLDGAAVVPWLLFRGRFVWVGIARESSEVD